MDENTTKVKNIIVDTNVLISSLVKSEGVTRAALALLFKQPNVNLLIPKLFYREIKFHANEIARKAGVEYRTLFFYLKELLKMFRVIDEDEFKEFINEARELVRDEKDISFVALALRFRPSIIMTYNKKHYRQVRLEKRNIKVKTPIETLKEIGISTVIAKTELKKKRGFVKLLSKLIALFKKNFR